MGQKVRPTGFRTGIFLPWQSTWFAGKKDFAELLFEDQKIRKFIHGRYKGSGISKVRIERTREKVVVVILTSKVGVIIGKKGQRMNIGDNGHFGPLSPIICPSKNKSNTGK